VAEFEFGFEEVGLQPVDGLVVEAPVHPAVDHRHGCAHVSQDRHDGLYPGTALCQLRTQGVAESVGADGPGPIGIDQSCGLAGLVEGVVKERRGRQEPSLTDKNVLLEAPCGRVVPSPYRLWHD
jgi:hypothetical protein